MAKIKIGDFLLDQQLSTLKKNEVETVVEPKLLELLLLFCQHPNRIISREEILEKIWQNSIVTDNAINKMVGNLRRLLLDDPKTPRYIQTVPKRGYRLICSVDIVSNIPIVSMTKNPLNDCHKDEVSVPALQKKNYAYWFVIIGVFSLLLVVILNVSSNKTAFTISKTQELTRQQGLEFSALHSESGRYVLFLKKAKINDISQLWRKNLSSNQESLIGTHDLNIFKLIAIDNQSGKNNQKLLFIASKNKQCFIYQADWSTNKELANIEPVMDCTTMSINDIDFDSSSKQLIYSALKANDQTSRIYRYELSSKKHFLMAQPEPLGIGNHSVDISPDGKKLLIMRSNADLHTQLFVLILKSNKIIEYQQFNYFVREAIWHHDSENILYFPPPPAHQILMGDLSGENNHTVVSISEYLSRNMSLIADGESLLFATNSADYSNRWLTGKNKGNLLDNSTVYEMLPALLSDDKHYLYISKRSGKSQLYMGDFASGSSTVLTQLENYLVFKHISVSLDNNAVLLATNNRVWQLPLKALREGSLTIKTLDDYQIFRADGFIENVNWLSSSVISLTYKNENRLQLSLVDLKTEQELKLDNMWSYAVSANQKNEKLFLVHSIDHSVYQISLSKLLAAPLSNAKTSKNYFVQTDMKLSTKFKQLKVFKEKLYFIDNSSRNVKLSSLPLKGEQQLESYKIKRSYGFDVSSLGILLNELVSREGDIHRTSP
ncbi:MAG: winged helix-turn-helix domain-containing protein [Colwellia sp.]|nr:winged helix-turn-helix domain-containing protein [Colwellia sp.]